VLAGGLTGVTSEADGIDVAEVVDADKGNRKREAWCASSTPVCGVGNGGFGSTATGRGAYGVYTGDGEALETAPSGLESTLLLCSTRPSRPAAPSRSMRSRFAAFFSARAREGRGNMRCSLDLSSRLMSGCVHAL